MADVHGPVDHYATDLEARVDVFFDRFRVDRPVWRRNMSFKTTHALYLPYSKLEPVDAPTEVSADGSPYWMRSERQTLRKLPRTGAILFTIRVQLAPVGRAPPTARQGGRRAGDDRVVGRDRCATSRPPTRWTASSRWLRTVAGSASAG